MDGLYAIEYIIHVKDRYNFNRGQADIVSGGQNTFITICVANQRRRNGDLYGTRKTKRIFNFYNYFWLIGFVIFGGIASANKELLDIPWNTILIMLVYGLGGGLLLGGLVSGIILFSSFFKR